MRLLASLPVDTLPLDIAPTLEEIATLDWSKALFLGAAGLLFFFIATASLGIRRYNQPDRNEDSSNNNLVLGIAAVLLSVGTLVGGFVEGVWQDGSRAWVAPYLQVQHIRADLAKHDAQWEFRETYIRNSEEHTEALDEHRKWAYDQREKIRNRVLALEQYQAQANQAAQALAAGTDPQTGD